VYSCARRDVICARRCNGVGEMASIGVRGNRGLRGGGKPLSRRMIFCDAAVDVLTYSVDVEVSISPGIHQGLIQGAAAVDPNPTVSRSSGSAKYSSPFPLGTIRWRLSGIMVLLRPLLPAFKHADADAVLGEYTTAVFELCPGEFDRSIMSGELLKPSRRTTQRP